MTQHRNRKPAPKPTADKAPAEQEQPADAAPPRRPDSRTEVVTVDECTVDGCPVFEFEPGRGLCMDHFTTRLDLRGAARHVR